MLNANFILGVIPAAMQLALAGLFIRRRHYKRFPWFFIYTLYSIAATIARLAVISRPRLFYNVYWTGEVIYGALALMSMREVFKIASDIFYFGSGWLRLVPTVAVFSVIAYAVWQGAYYAPGTSAMAHLQAGAYALFFGIRYLEIGICFLCLRLTWQEHFPITWQRYDFGILIGFGSFGLFSLLVYLARLTFNLTSLEGVFRYAPAIAYGLTTAIWLRTFVRDEPPVNKVPPTSEEIQEKLATLDGYIDELGDEDDETSRFDLRPSDFSLPLLLPLLDNSNIFLFSEQNATGCDSSALRIDNHRFRLYLLAAFCQKGESRMTHFPWSWSIAAGTGGVLVKLLKEAGRFRTLSIDDVGSCLQQPDEQLICDLLDPDSQDARLARRKVGNYRRTQRARLNELQEHYSRMYHNGLLLKWWARRQQYDIVKYKLRCRKQILNELKELRQKATRFCSACRMALQKISFWSLMRFDEIVLAPVPRMCGLRMSRGIDIPQAYQDLKTVAVSFIRRGYGEDTGRAFAKELCVALG